MRTNKTRFFAAVIAVIMCLSLLPTAFPNVLVSANMGIAVGMASQICGFNLAEVCDTTVAWLREIRSTVPSARRFAQ